MTMTDTASTGAETPIQPAVDAPAVEFTEEQARQWLASSDGVPSVRVLAKLWGWHPSKVYRFVTRVRGETVRETPGETVSETPTVSAETPETPETPESPIAIAPYRDDFDWSPENEAVIMPSQQAIAVYFNRWGQIVIRAEGADGDEDVFICISPEHLPRVIAKLTAILKESTGGGGAR